MQFALDENNKRIDPAFSGQRAKCEYCGGDLVAHCGDFRIKHWQHLNIDKDCDPWQEHETQWHRDWKTKFPKDWQEVVIENEFEKHRADVKTKLGVIIEFQNSSIQSTTIKIRENFYGNMIWVINAKEFSQNFKLYSTVKNRLQYLDLSTDNTFSEVEKSYDNIEKQNNEEIKKIESQLLELKWEIDRNNDKIEYHKPIQEEVEKLTALILNSWKDNKYFYEYKLDNTLLKNIENTYKSTLTNLFQNLKEIESEIFKNIQNLNSIESLENIMLDSIQMKVLSYEKIPPKFFDRVKAIYPETKNSFFPRTISFATETEFQTIGYRRTQYLFAIDAQPSIDEYKKKLKDLNETKVTLEKSISDNNVIITKTIKEEFEKIIIASNESILKTNVEIEKLKSKIEKCNQRNDRLKTQREKEIEELMKEQEVEIKIKRSQIMTKFKGLYHFDWKHKRPSWSVSKKTIYFDTGKEFLLEKISDEQVRKVDKLDFVKKLMTDYNGSQLSTSVVG